MKAKKLSSAVLVSLLGAGLSAPLAANAEAQTQTGKGKIEFTQDNSSEDIIDPDVPADEVTIPNGNISVNDDRNSFSIDAVSDLDFGSHDVGSYTSAQVYYAKPITLTTVVPGAEGDAAKSEVKTRGNFVQFTDKRAQTNHNYTVSAALTKQFKTADNDILKGASLTYSNLSINSKKPAENYPTPETSFTLQPGANDGSGESVLAVTSNNKVTAGVGEGTPSTGNAEQGIGTYSLQFGKYDSDTTKDTSANSIALTVPNNNVFVSKTYTAEITWTIAEVL